MAIMGRPRIEIDFKEFDRCDKFDDHLENIRVNKEGVVLNRLTGNILKPTKMQKGHLQVSISKHGIVKKYLVHRLVAFAFIENKENKPCVNHKNGNPADNSVENLEWCTDYENKQHAKINKMFQSSTDRYNAKFDEFEILTIHSLSWSHTAISKYYGCSQSVITRIKNCDSYKNFAVIYDK
jgi:hypothetical protein